jgi:hypothetical protein
MTNQIKPLDLVFISKGYLHVYVTGSENEGGYIYAKHTLPDGANKESLLNTPFEQLNATLGVPQGLFEVFLHKVRKENTMTIGDTTVNYPACIVYPSDNDFGNTAWACCMLERAKIKLKYEVERRKTEQQNENR